MERLTEYTTVTVNMPFASLRARTMETFEARVLAIVGRTAALEPLEPMDGLSLPDRMPDTLISFRHEQSLVGLKGLLVARHETGDLRFTVGDGVQLPRRRATRVKVSLPLTVRRSGRPGTHPATTVDLSADGILMETGFPAAPDDLVHLAVSLPDDDGPLPALAHVVRRGGGMVAVQLEADEREARSRLGHFVVEFNRQVLRAHAATMEDVEF